MMKNFVETKSAKRLFAFGAFIFLASAMTLQGFAQSRKISGGGTSARPVARAKRNVVARKKNGGDEVGVPTTGAVGIPRATAEIMQSQLYAPASKRPPLLPERNTEQLEKKKQDPDAKPLSRFPNQKRAFGANETRDKFDAPFAPQTIGTNFTGATLSDTRAFPPDSMGAVGPAQFVVFVNGRLRTFNKTTGAADGALNVNPDTFFSSVETPIAGTVTQTFTSDPQVRYDRLTGRWFLLIIDVPCTSADCSTTAANRVLLAVSDAASAGVISSSTVWTFYYVQQDTTGGVASTGEFLDYPSLGVDANALYVGGNMFAASGSFSGTNGYVIRKSSVLNGGPIVATAFRALAGSTTAEGPYTPRGVDNYDPAATEGYFIGVSTTTYGRLITRRVGTPGGTPTISANLTTTVSATSDPILIPHLGNTGGNNGQLDSLDDRLFAAHIRNGRLWTAHNIAVTTAGVAATSGSTRRTAARWYELVVPTGTGTPTVNQSGTIFDSAATNPRHYWIPSITVSGQGHAAIAFSFAGLADNPGAATSGRLAGDTLGTTQAVTTITTAGGAYNPTSDTGGTGGRRWGDYSLVSLDPQDDMTMWTVQDYCNATNSYGVRVAKLIAPPPAAIADGANNGVYNVTSGQTSFSVTVNGTSTSGSGFYDPGANLPSPALPFKHITASISGANVTVNSVVYNSPTSITLNLNTVGALKPQLEAVNSLRDLTITNPDGQSVTRTGILNIVTPSATTVTVGGKVRTAAGRGIANAKITITDGAGNQRTVVSNSFGYYHIANVPAGATYTFSISAKRYTFDKPTFSLNVNGEINNLNFTAQ